VDDGNQALFGLLNEETNEKTEILPVAENFPQKNETPVDIFSNEETAHIDDIAVSSPLGELDTEIISFIEKLEALRKNGTTDTQYQEKLDAVTEREKALEEEVSVRKKALEYEKAEIIREQEEQKAEEARLTRIID
jgi:flagellar motility protein MotE (MotC chaperone)